MTPMTIRYGQLRSLLKALPRTGNIDDVTLMDSMIYKFDKLSYLKEPEQHHMVEIKLTLKEIKFLQDRVQTLDNTKAIPRAVANAAIRILGM